MKTPAERLDPTHERIRLGMRIAGPAVLALGLGFVAVGLASFFQSFGTFEPPRYFWCCFLGMPLFILGVGISQFAYMGAVAQFLHREMAPVHQDTFNRMARGTRPGVRTLAEAVGEGIAAGLGAQAKGHCPACGAAAPAGARFCPGCGAALGADE